jgi:hypothetical protein
MPAIWPVVALQLSISRCWKDEKGRTRATLLNAPKATALSPHHGARFVELNQTALGAVIKLYRRAELLGASDPEHYLLPADLSKHTKSFDPLAGGRGYDVTQHQCCVEEAS